MNKCKVCGKEGNENMLDHRQYFDLVFPIFPFLNKEDMWMCQECFDTLSKTLEMIKAKQFSIGVKK